MFQQCLRHYGLDTDGAFVSALQKLSLLCHMHHNCGYSASPAKHYCLSLSEASALLDISIIMVEQSLHYGALFGLLSQVTVSPQHVEFTLNPYHRRDLFFANLRIMLRENSLHTSY